MSTESAGTGVPNVAPGHGLTTKQSLLAAALVLMALASVPVMVFFFQRAFPVKPWPGDPAAAAAAEAPVDGAALYTASCSACHGPNAKGVPGLGKNMTTSEFVKGLDNLDLLAFIKKGRPVDDPKNTTKIPMPPKGGHPDLTDDQILGIIYWVREQK